MILLAVLIFLSPPTIASTVFEDELSFDLADEIDIDSYWEIRNILNEMHEMVRDEDNAFVLIRAEMQYMINDCESPYLADWMGELCHGNLGLSDVKKRLKYANDMLGFYIPREVHAIRNKAEKVYIAKENYLVIKKMLRIKNRVINVRNYSDAQDIIRDMNKIIRGMTTDQWNAFNNHSVFNDIAQVQGRFTRGNNVKPTTVRLGNQFKRACVELLGRSQ